MHWNLSDLGWGKAAWSSFYGPWQMGACVFALDAPGKFDPALTLDTLAAFPDHHLVRAAHGAAADRAAGLVALALSAPAALRQRRRTAEPGGAQPLAARRPA